MKENIERRKPEGLKDHIALAVTTCGVGYLPLAPGTWGSMVGVLVYLLAGRMLKAVSYRVSTHDPFFDFYNALITTTLAGLLILLCLLGIWAAERAMELLGSSDPSEAVIDEIIGQLVTFLFIPFTFAFVSFDLSWKMLLAGFMLFRLFDIWKPYPIDDLQHLHGGLGICADDIVAGIYAGVCLSVIYALSFSL
ncbi:MAG: phosphatidylglycerophosphatase A [Acidobacteria bacterium]|nr:phosphatidylglycerophosphatase A [Acidobacteriota bacterium]